ncbi:uncharacterized protein B0I36DRAFT_124860 [Microdochium trichocladiopsis]|uniref:Uncharacterized protein n=1 Tax=Microdochium trichocladiopsis TaxID=1682393 RepID=A0A9P9BNU7_9PEZI|nr:uncharacterized protein B0I36DRAFT_124860 [Microdochium trichocladiopsis]KAH7031606.1 hypothetical protein B0I36DRAFT_124860 [Microdochium trichocladiopsis]
MPDFKMPIRNPFAKRLVTDVQDENARPALSRDASSGFERVDTVGSKASSVLSLRSNRSQDTGDYKLIVNDSGVFIPPSPAEEKHEALWPRRPAASARTSVDGRSSIGDIEHFGISRESFDSYRRSFDISAKSPVMVQERPRQSLDSARFPRFPRANHRGPSIDIDQPTLVEEGFEDVGLHDEHKHGNHQGEQPKKRSFFSKLTDSQEPHNNAAAPSQGMSRFIPGRKRAPSTGQEAELGSMQRMNTLPLVDAQEMR